jgi:hypothetical protein
LIAGDRDFMKAAQSVKNTGREFCLLRVGTGVSGDLSRAADCFIDAPLGDGFGPTDVEAAIESLEVQEPSVTDEELRELQEHFAGREGHEPQKDLPVPVGGVEPIPLADIGRVFTLEKDEIDYYLDGCVEDVRGYLLTVFPRVRSVIDGETHLGRPVALKHLVNMLAGDPWSNPVPLGMLVMEREDLFHLVKLAASYGVLVRQDGFTGITSYKLSAEHGFVKWLDEVSPEK